MPDGIRDSQQLTVNPRFTADFEKQWLAKEMMKSLLWVTDVNTAPAPIELALVCKVKGRFHDGNRDDSTTGTRLLVAKT